MRTTRSSYPACVGLGRIGDSKWPWKQQRYECWNDMISRKYPWYLRLVPNKYLDWNNKGVYLKCLAKFKR